MEKIYKSILVGATLVSSTALAAIAAEKPAIFSPTPGEVFQIIALSDNGVYAITETAGNQEVDNPQPMGGQILNISTGEITKILPSQGTAGVYDVADNGTVAGSSGGVPATWDLQSGSWTTLPTPFRTDCGSLLSITADGHYGVGYAGYSNDILYAEPVLYDLYEGKLIDTPNLPTVDLAGENNSQNVFYGVSPDGRYVLGQMSQSYWYPVGLFSYIYDTHTDTWKAIGYDFDPATEKFTCTYPDLHFIINQKMSCNGQWVTGSAYIVTGGGDMAGGSEYRAAYRYNIAQDKLEVYNSAADREIGGNSITDDGIVLGCTPATSPYPSAQIRSGNFFIGLDQVLSQVYGMTLQSQIGDNITGEFRCLSSDGLTAVMGTYDNCYIIKMNESFADAAARVDLLSNYTLSIPQGSSIAKLGELKLTFDREIACKNLPSQVQLLKEDGTVVRNALTTAVAAGNDHQIIVTFRTTTLDPGKTYTVRIPQDYIWLKDEPSVKSKELNLTYLGREAEAVKAVRVTPGDGAVVSSLDSSSSYITLLFDTDIKASGNGTCAIYNADDNRLVTTLSGMVSGRTLYLYPEGECKLYYGSNYRVEIGQGVVTDLSGFGENEAMTLTYKGSYVRSLSDDDITLFSSDCNDYDKFIFWQNEFNEPGPIPAGWGFTADNPWLLVRDSDEDVDQALAAHSMFTRSGTSDDWLIIPQLYIPDDKTTLTFDAQSYLHSKADRLKVYLYECDMVYNYFSYELTQEVIQKGHILLDEVLSAGRSDEILVGDWTRYVISLEDYVGKNVYIAFVNNNTDQSAIFIDNVSVSRQLDLLVTNSTPTLVVAQSQVNVQGIITSAADNLEYKDVELKLIDSEGTVVDRITDASAMVSSQNPYTFRFDNALPLEVGEVNHYTLDITVGDKNVLQQYSVKDLAFEVSRKVVLEEYSGTTCANCPLGFIAVEHLSALYPDNFIPVLVRTYGGDMYSTNVTGYSSFLGLEAVGAPSGRINRGEPLFPMIHDGESYRLSGRGIVQSDGTEAYLWSDAVQDEMATPAELSIEPSVSFDAQSQEITVDVTVSSALNLTDRSINLFALVTEDDLVTPQSNNLGTVSDPILGEWGVGGAYSKTMIYPYYIDDVARFCVTGRAYNGVPMSVSTFLAGESYNETLSTVLTQDAVNEISKCSVVVMAIDANTGRVLNANKSAITPAAVENVDASVQMSLSDGNIQICCVGSLSAQVYTPYGTLVSTASGTDMLQLQTSSYKGIAIIVVTTEGSTFTRKLIIK